jgi:hypothetical protein
MRFVPPCRNQVAEVPWRQVLPVTISFPAKSEIPPLLSADRTRLHSVLNSQDLLPLPVNCPENTFKRAGNIISQ